MPLAGPPPRRYEGRMNARSFLAACALTVLSACAQSNTSSDLAAAAPPPPPSVPGAPAPAAATPPPAPAQAPEPKVALTPEEAKGQCWMKYENDKKVKNIDARLILVEKCVDETMRGQLVQNPRR